MCVYVCFVCTGKRGEKENKKQKQKAKLKTEKIMKKYNKKKEGNEANFETMRQRDMSEIDKRESYAKMQECTKQRDVEKAETKNIQKNNN